MSKVKSRYYAISENRIIRVGADSNGTTKYPRMANLNALLFEVLYVELPAPMAIDCRTALIYFDGEGKWHLDPFEDKKAAHLFERSLLNNASEGKVSFIIPHNKVTLEQKKMLKDRMLIDFGNNFWDSVAKLLYRSIKK